MEEGPIVLTPSEKIKELKEEIKVVSYQQVSRLLNTLDTLELQARHIAENEDVQVGIRAIAKLLQIEADGKSKTIQAIRARQ